MDKSANVIYIINLKKTWSGFNHMQGEKKRRNNSKNKD